MEFVNDVKIIGDRIYEARKKMELTQAQVAEAADLSDRAYANIERGTVNVKILSLLKICSVLKTDPNSLLSTNYKIDIDTYKSSIINVLFECSDREKDTAFKLIKVYAESLEHGTSGQG